MLSKESANQLAMLLSLSLPAPAKPYWTISQVLQSALPAELTCEGDRILVKDSTVPVDLGTRRCAPVDGIFASGWF